MHSSAICSAIGERGAFRYILRQVRILSAEMGSSSMAANVQGALDASTFSTAMTNSTAYCRTTQVP
jgi:hypothetical protein